ncbi:CHAT domain-containing tetratricopeptide repeat protein [Roseofilum capinflatum]|uniref:CHAT domain-containing protein n=1 Tax=Roseofilum capinflatum BLCC-M114 TaxID=3022440 RepID=A0ABT7BBP1_9CYAN|nr:CHAT domain-containing protein [Roseofilum capinflatum]MDJ1176607.1 CHAT domain-containing protein [Roseofilum capinflatum BLCC-M114]
MSFNRLTPTRFRLWLFAVLLGILLAIGGEKLFAPIPFAPHRPHAEPLAWGVESSPEAMEMFREGMKHYTQGTATGLREALKSWEVALKLSQESENTAQEIIILNWMGLTYRELGEFDQAFSLYNQLLPRTASRPQTEASVLLSLAQVHTKLSNTQEALDMYNQALGVWRSVNFQTGEAATLNNIGVVYTELGDYNQALATYNRALELVKELGNSKSIAATLNNIGGTYSDLERYSQALIYYQDALELWQEEEDLRGKASTFNNIGFVYAKLDKLDNALATYVNALPLWEKLGDRAGKASTLNNLGYVYAQQGDLELALTYYNQALELRRQVGDRPKEALTLYSIAQAQRQHGDLELAQTTIESALTLIEDLRTRVSAQDLRSTFFASKQEYYEFYIDLLMELHRNNPDRGYDAQALEAKERASGRSLLDLLTEAKIDLHTGVDPALVAQETDLREQLSALEERKLRLLRNHYQADLAAQLDREIEELLLTYRDVRARIRATSPHYANLTQPQPLTVAQMQQQVVDRDTTLITYALGKERSTVWVLNSNGLHSAQLPSREAIEKAAAEFREAVIAPTLRIRRRRTEGAAHILSTMILDPIAPYLEGERLAIISDGGLQYIPWAAIAAPASVNTYTPLIVDYELVTLPSASSLGQLRQDIAQRQPAPKTLAILADPVFSPQDNRLKLETQPAENFLPPELERSAREAGLIFDRLPFTQAEAEEILALLPPEQTTQGFGFQASKAIATSPDISQYRILHFATHGLLNSITPELSGLVLSLLNPEGEAIDGFLRLHEIYNLDLRAELVVLSACETGLGKAVRGEGLIGLTRGFLYAGAARAIVSLWQVDDRATAQLMIHLYQNMLQNNLSPAAALRAAQLELWNSEEYQLPYFWAAFTLQGEWQPSKGL